VKRSPLKRKTPLRPGKGLSRGEGLRRSSSLARRKAPKRRSRGVDPKLYEQVLLRDGGCVARGLVPEVACFGRIDPHHRLMRSQGGPDTAENLISVCRSHHDWIHGHPAKSYDLDLLRHRDRLTDRPEED
jgi:hypothetical protein